jgi:hypothetical protein
MLADQVTVRTKAAPEESEPSASSTEGDHRGWCAEIDGAHGFIALYPDDTAPTPSGTEVTLWLKSRLVPFDREQLLRRLREEFYGIQRQEDGGSAGAIDTSAEDETAHSIEPAFAVARYVVWPPYSVYLEPPGANQVMLDHEMDLLATEVLPLRRRGLGCCSVSSARDDRSWDARRCTISPRSDPRWHVDLSSY